MPLSWRKGRERGTHLEHAGKIDDAVTTSWACFARVFHEFSHANIFVHCQTSCRLELDLKTCAAD